MAYINIENFKAGLDTRRSELSSSPGTLQQLNNAHINEGGECEKRKAFVPQITLPIGTGYTFGMLPTATSILVFGSATSGTVGALAAPFVYQQLIHPSGNLGTPMTGVKSATLFSGNAFVAATYLDGKTYCYYAGQLVEDFIAGLATPWSDTDAEIATAIAALVNATATSVVTGEPIYTASVDGTSTNVDIFSTPSITSGTPFNVVTDVTTAGSGALSASQTSTGTPSTALAQSVASFQFLAAQAVAGGGTAATATLTVVSEPNVNDIVAVGPNGSQTTYTFVTTLNNSVGGQILRVSNTTTQAQYIAEAINATPSGAGVHYSTPTTANTYVTANNSTNTVVLTAITIGTAGNSLIMTTFPAQGRLTPAGNTNLSGGSNSGGVSSVTNINYGSTNLLSGTVGLSTTYLQLASDVANNITANSGSNGGFTAQANSGTVTIFSPNTSPAGYNGAAITVIVTGQIIVQQMGFTITGLTAATSAISSITVGGGSNILTATLTYQDAGHSTETVTGFCIRVAANIFANSGTSGYTAVGVDIANDPQNTSGIIYISPLTSTSTTTPGTVAITYTTPMTVTATGSAGLQGALSQSSISGSLAFQQTGGGLEGQPKTGYYVFITGTVTALPVNGTPPYSYKWAYTGGGTPTLTASSPTKAATAWHRVGSIPTPYTETWACTITDSSPTPQTATTPNLTIYV